MKQIEKRLKNLEYKEDVKKRALNISRIIIDTREQVDHPERFRRVLESEDAHKSGAVRRIYNLERI